MAKSQRYERGVAALSALVNYWLGSSGMSHDRLAAIADWAMGERGMLNTTVLSRIRNAKQAHGASIKNLDAMAAANQAIWRWQSEGQHAIFAELGPCNAWGIPEKWLNDAIWLPSPKREGEALDFADFAAVLVGRLELPYLAPTQLSSADARRLNDGLGRLLEKLISERKWRFREAISQLLDAYPANDAARRHRLRSIIIGDLRLSKDELEGELYPLAQMVRVVRCLGEERYGQKELILELMSLSQES
jgi:hypothetical protein